MAWAFAGCGSVTPRTEPTGAAGAAAGASGGAGSASAGTSGAAGAASAGTSGGVGAAGSIGAAGSTGAAGTSAAAGTGGGQDGGARDAAVDARDAGKTVCEQVVALDRSCKTDADCVGVLHTINCCGTATWIAINTAVKPSYSTLEAECDRGYPACGCAAFGTTADDGSLIADGKTAGVTCQAGACRTYAVGCGHPCEAGRSCEKCSAGGKTTTTCMLRCSKPADCTDPMVSMCLSFGPTGVCVDPTAMCGAP